MNFVLLNVGRRITMISSWKWFLRFLTGGKNLKKRLREIQDSPEKKSPEVPPFDGRKV
tara:strand:- start:6112 stop:6285 length:174 start_codon:yes stop_codon:yes gene_type:complete